MSGGAASSKGSWARRLLKGILIAAVSVLILIAALVVLILVSDRGKILLPVKHTEAFESDRIAEFPSRLRSDGNRLVNAEGTSVRLTGLMPPDPARLHNENRFGRKLFEEMRARGANVVRIPVHPENWKRDKDYLWRYIDPAVRWCGELGMYAIIDWHSIGNVVTGTAPLMPELYCHTYEMTLDFWRMVAKHFTGTPNVIFEIFNEPQGIEAAEWTRAAQEIIGTIRAQGADQLVIVGGLEYGRDLSWVFQSPIDDPNVAYASHIYPSHSQAMWWLWFGDVARERPVVMTEWGFMDENRNAKEPYLTGTREAYGEPLLGCLDELGAGWVACWYDDSWNPPMFTDGWKGRTRYGEFVFEKLAEGPRQTQR